MEPLLVGPEEGDEIADRAERSLVIKVERDELTLTLMRYEQGERGPDPHVHRKHSDCFYVIDGQVTFEVGGEVVRGDPGTFVVVPPNVVHTFRNEDSASARFLNVHAPSCGFHDHLRAMRDGGEEAEPFDQHAPPADGGRPRSDALIERGEASGEQVALAELDLGPGERLHTSDSSTSYWVLDGTLTVRAGDDGVEATTGDCVALPPGTAHSLIGPARVVTVRA